jgi:hypothetical protein
MFVTVDNVPDRDEHRLRPIAPVHTWPCGDSKPSWQVAKYGAASLATARWSGASSWRSSGWEPSRAIGT